MRTAVLRFFVLEKRRRGDRLVEISVPNMAYFRARTPVLVDDIISSARTMIEAALQLRTQTAGAVVCIGVYAVFGDDAYQALRSASARVVTTNTIPYETNQIDVSPLLVDAVRGAI